MREFSYYRDATAYKNTNLTTSVAIAQAVFMLFDSSSLFLGVDVLDLTDTDSTDYGLHHLHLYKTFCNFYLNLLTLCELETVKSNVPRGGFQVHCIFTTVQTERVW